MRKRSKGFAITANTKEKLYQESGLGQSNVTEEQIKDNLTEIIHKQLTVKNKIALSNNKNEDHFIDLPVPNYLNRDKVYYGVNEKVF